LFYLVQYVVDWFKTSEALRSDLSSRRSNIQAARVSPEPGDRSVHTFSHHADCVHQPSCEDFASCCQPYSSLGLWRTGPPEPSPSCPSDRRLRHRLATYEGRRHIRPVPTATFAPRWPSINGAVACEHVGGCWHGPLPISGLFLPGPDTAVCSFERFCPAASCDPG